MMRIAAAAALLMVTTLALGACPAAARAAGFAKQSIFLSQQSVIEGETVLIHTIVAADAQRPFDGTLTLRDGEDTVGSVPVSLKAGEAAAVSMSWKPQAGKHEIAAELADQSGAVAEKASETFTVKEPPRPAATSSGQAAASIESSAAIQDQISKVSPGAQAAVQPVFAAIDSGRNAAADALDGQLTLAKAKMGDVEGAQDERPEGGLPDTVGGFWLALWTLYFYLLTILRFVVGNAALFYPVFALALLYIIWKTFRRFGRRS